jgi:hypothetical protein
MAPRNAPRRKIRSPYSGSLFSCPPGCGCPDCRIRDSRSPAEIAVKIVAIVVGTIALALFLKGAL